MSLRVAVTRDEAADGPLSTALRAAGFTPVLCPVAEERPPADTAPLLAAARDLERYTWAVFASRRAVLALSAARASAWPAGLRTAAVGAATASALVDAGVDIPPFVAPESGAQALWSALEPAADWKHTRVLVPAVRNGRRSVIDGLIRAGADVTVVEAYRMEPRPAGDIARDWNGASPDAAVLGSPHAADLLVAAIGREALARLSTVVAIGATTGVALEHYGVEAVVSAAQSFEAAARALTSSSTHA